MTLREFYNQTQFHIMSYAHFITGIGFVNSSGSTTLSRIYYTAQPEQYLLSHTKYWDWHIVHISITMGEFVPAIMEEFPEWEDAPVGVITLAETQEIAETYRQAIREHLSTKDDEEPKAGLIIPFPGGNQDE